MIFDKLQSIDARYHELTGLLADPAVQSDPAKYREHAKALSEIQPLVEKYGEYTETERQIAQAEEIARGTDPDMRELAQEELRSLVARRDSLAGELKVLLLPKDPNDEKNVVLEIRAGTGGEEAALFAAELFRMYSRFAERQGWRIDVLSTSETGGPR